MRETPKVRQATAKARSIFTLLSILSSAMLIQAQIPTISGIAVTTDTNTAVVKYTISANGYCWVKFGESTGSYPFSSNSFLSTTFSPGGFCSVAINGLKDGTLYYFLPTTRPNADNDTDACVNSGCGAVEVSAITPAESVSHLPAPPASVQANLLSEPDTTGYTIVSLIDGGSGVSHEC